MNLPPLDRSKQERLERVAADYRRQGYDVKVQPSGYELPEFLKGLEPDLIADGLREKLVIQVRIRGEFEDVAPTEAFELAVNDQPGWRFEIVIDGQTRDRRQTLSPTQIRGALQEAADLEERKHPAAALLLLWSATEGALRLLAEQENVTLDSPTPTYVVKRLYSLGVLGRNQYLILDSTLQLRNQAAHGFQVTVGADDLAGIAEVLNQVLEELELKAA